MGVSRVSTTTFTGLTDTPAAYTGKAKKVLVVNNAEDTIEFIAAGSLNLDGGHASTNYSGTSAIDGGNATT